MIQRDELERILSENGFRLERQTVGEGGSARVHKAIVAVDGHSTNLPKGAAVAVKEFRGRMLGMPGQVERILQEANQTYDHPHLVKTFGLIAPPAAGEEGAYLLAMEWFDGAPLDKWLDGDGANADWAERARIAHTIVDAVAALHGAKVLHRDLKAENVFVLRDNSVRVMDLGIAEVHSNEHTMHTAAKDFIGSMRFASPQFIAGEKFAPADDVYAIGTILFHLATGRRVYDNVERKALIPKVVLDGPPALPALRADVPPALSVVVTGCLHRDRNRRPTLEELRAAIQHPADCAYVRTEEQRRREEQRGYLVLDVSDDNVFADLCDVRVSPVLGEIYTVVRACLIRQRDGTGRRRGEEWVASVRCMHIADDIAHFVIVNQQWVPEKGTAPLLDRLLTRSTAVARPGHFEFSDTTPRRIFPGDRIVGR